VLAAEVRAIIRYHYEAENEDELTLTEGDIITVLDQNLVDTGWWKGELKGRVGVFPDNFVELLPAAEVSNFYVFGFIRKLVLMAVPATCILHIVSSNFIIIKSKLPAGA